jgi:putative ABC transport system permease protein
VDFSIEGSEQEVRGVLDSEESKSMIDVYYPMFLSRMNTNLYDQSGEILKKSPNAHEFSWVGLHAALANLPETDLRNNMIENFSDRRGRPYIISETSYNELLQAIGKEQIQLKKNQVALYTSMKDRGDFMNILNGALELGAYIEVDGQKYELLSSVYYDNVVADRKITLSSAIIVSDEDYRNWVYDASTPFCWNVVLNQEIVKEKGLMQAIKLMEQNIMGTGLEYESFISGIGRNLFYTVAASYLTIYLGVLFMVIANTVIGLKYLMQQRANKHRYTTLLMLGASVNELCESARSQIRLFFALALGVAVCSSIFAILSMFTSFLRLPVGTSVVKVIVVSGIVAILFVVVEFIYICIVERTSSREIQALQVTARG